VLACFIVDALGDGLAEGMFNLFFSENFRARDSLAALAVGLLSAAASVTLRLGGRVIDRFPRDGPLGMVPLTKTVMGAVLLVVLFVELVTRHAEAPRYAAFGSVLVLLLVVYMPLEALGSLAYTLTIKRATEGRDERVRATLYNFQYAAYNLAAVGANLGITALRSAFGKTHVADANRVIVGSGAALFAVAAIAGGRLFQHLRTDPRFHAASGKKAASAPGAWSTLRSRPMATFLLMKVSLIGAALGSVAVGGLLPKYLIRHFDESTLYALFLAINPALMIGLALVLPFTPLVRVNALLLLVAGTAVQALAPLWVVVAPGAEWAVAAYMVTFTVGEAIAMPRLNAFIMTLIPAGQEGFFVSVGQVPGILASIGLNAVTGVLLETYCPTAAACATEAGAHLLWLWVAGAAAATPLLVLALHLFHVHVEARAAPDRI
jgi:hypothetical protein